MSQTATAAREPLLRIAKREGTTMPQKIAVRAIAILLALVVDALFIFFVTGLNPLSVYGVMWSGTFANMTRFSWMLRDLSTLLCVGIALAPAFKMRFWNCGGEGQILIGGLTAALIMVYQGNNLPLPLLFAAMALGSIAAGALWGFIPAWFKSRWNTNETLFTLMMNYVATSIVACMTNIMRGQASSLGTLNKATKAGWFPVIMGQRYTINIIVVIVLTFVMYAYLRFSKQGYEISVVGESENTARYAGINVRRVTVRTMLISGAICGLCGFLIVAGKDQTISTASANGRGFTAIIVAWLAKFNTFYMALISFLLVFLERGASEIASAYSLNEYAADIITGIILFFILGSEFFINYRVIPRGAHRRASDMHSSLIAWIMRAIPFGTIIMYGALGETVTEKSGNLNLGVPGIMYLGGFAGFASAWAYENSAANPNGFVSILIALSCAILASMAGGLIYAFLTISLRANQNVTGLALTTFGMGVANFFGVFILNGASYSAAPIANKAFSAKIPVLSGLGDIGQVVFSYGFLVYAAILLAVVLHWFLTRTRAGLNLRAVGENPATADAAGINVTLYKYLSTCIGAGICGIGGLYYVLDYNQGIWATTGQIEALGWLAVALVIFTTWKPLNAIWGAYLFGMLYWLYQFLPSLLGITMASHITDLVQMLPYVVTIIVLIVVSMRKKKENQPPAHLGLAYFREER